MDYVLPFVNCTDPVWRSQYRSVNLSLKFEEARFRPFGTLRYAFRSVAENMPFIDRIVLIVSTESQVPEWVNRDWVRVVLHDEFIPEKFRPTFNSSAIETFMWRIGGLSDLFVYGNDDFFALRPVTEDDFFCDGKPRLTFSESCFKVQTLFRRCCRNGMDRAADAAGVPRSDPLLLLKPQHCMKGMTVRHMNEIGRRCDLEDTVTVLRHWYNVTGYIYQYFAYYTGEFEPFQTSFEYVRLTNMFEDALEKITNPQADLLCINDAGELDAEHYEAAAEALRGCFEERFPERCIYELF